MAVDDPGHGYLYVSVLGAENQAGALVAGPRLAEMLSDITTAVIENAR